MADGIDFTGFQASWMLLAMSSQASPRDGRYGERSIS